MKWPRDDSSPRSSRPQQHRKPEPESMKLAPQRYAANPQGAAARPLPAIRG